MINKVASSPSFKSEVRVIYRPSIDRALYNNMYKSDRFAIEAKKLEENFDDNIVTIYPGKDEKDANCMRMYILEKDDRHTYIAEGVVYHPKEIADCYSRAYSRIRNNPIKESIKVTDYLA